MQRVQVPKENFRVVELPVRRDLGLVGSVLVREYSSEIMAFTVFRQIFMFELHSFQE
jgi:hypothetical protein